MSKIINFHEVLDPVWFEKNILYLKNRYRIITTSELYAFYYEGHSMHNTCMITVDDGHISSYTIIYPILVKHQVPAVFFVSPEIAKREASVNFWFQELDDYDQEKLTPISQQYIEELKEENITGNSLINQMSVETIWKVIHTYQKLYSIGAKPPENMTVNQIKEIDSGGLVEIGAHTLTHPFLANETDIRSKEEIQLSIRQLEEILQHPILTFAYPNGRQFQDWGEREINYLKETSVKLAFSTSHRDFTASDSVYAIPRYGITIGSLFFIKLKLLLGERYLHIKQTLKKVCS